MDRSLAPTDAAAGIKRGLKRRQKVHKKSDLKPFASAQTHARTHTVVRTFYADTSSRSIFFTSHKSLQGVQSRLPPSQPFNRSRTLAICLRVKNKLW